MVLKAELLTIRRLKTTSSVQWAPCKIECPMWFYCARTAHKRSPFLCGLCAHSKYVILYFAEFRVDAFLSDSRANLLNSCIYDIYIYIYIIYSSDLYILMILVFWDYLFVGWEARNGDLSRLKPSGQPDHIIGILEISNHDILQ